MGLQRRVRRGPGASLKAWRVRRPKCEGPAPSAPATKESRNDPELLRHNAVLPVASPGATLGTDWEQRVDFARLRSDRSNKVRAALVHSDIGSLILFDMNNIRYTTATHIGNWARDKLFRCCLVMRGADPILWDIGSAARTHQMFAPWNDKANWRAGISSWRGSIPEEVGVERGNARRLAGILRDHGLAGEPVGVDVVELPVLRALEAEGLHIVDGHGLMQDIRAIKSADEIALLDHAAALVNGAYDELYRYLRAGIRENACVALVNQYLYENGSEEVEAVNSISGERCSPHPHVFSDRLIRPGDTAYSDIIHSFNGYRTCYYRTLNVGSADRRQREAYRRAREFMDNAISEIRPGATSADVVRTSRRRSSLRLRRRGGSVRPPVLPRNGPVELGAAADEPLPLVRSSGRARKTWSSPSRPIGRADGPSAARIEEEVLVTTDGCQLLTGSLADQLYVAGTRLFTGAGPAAPAGDRVTRGERVTTEPTVGWLGTGKMGSAMAAPAHPRWLSRHWSGTGLGGHRRLRWPPVARGSRPKLPTPGW